MQRPRSLHAVHGGVHFTQIATVRDINDFVRNLPESQRDNLFEVIKALDEAGLIQIENDGELWNPYGEVHEPATEHALPQVPPVS